MGQFGQELRKERESRGVALESITGVTKISVRHLQALEEEKFVNLPGGVLSKGIVRGYARVVGIDEDAWVSRYLAAYHESGQIKDDDAAWIEFAENVGRARKGNLRSGNGMRWAGVVALFTLLLLFGWYVAHYVSGREALAQEELRPPAMQTPAAPTSLPVPAPKPFRAGYRAQRPPAEALQSEAPAEQAAAVAASPATIHPVGTQQPAQEFKTQDHAATAPDTSSDSASPQHANSGAPQSSPQR